MANPQKEQGYTAIANEIMRALARIRISGEARQVLDVIFSQTYGYNKKQDAISLSQFCEKTGLKRPTICKALNKLKEMKLITQKDNTIANLYAINKDFDQWKPLPKKITITKKDNMHYPKRKSALPKKIHTITTTTKDNITKDNTVQPPASAEVKQVMDIFYKVNPTLNWGNKTQRLAVEEMISKFTLEKTIKLAEYAISIQGQPFSPTITTPWQLKEKAAALIAHWKRGEVQNNSNKIQSL